MTHELFHSLGIAHHHERIDRDLYIKINWLNIELPSWLQFKWNPFYLPDDIPYDCQSIMHYGSFAFALNRDVKTLTARNPEFCDLNRPSYTPTRADIKLLNMKYECQNLENNKPKYRYP